MNKKLLILIVISILVGGTAVYLKNIEIDLPVGTIEISNKVNGNFLVVDNKTGYVIQGQENAKSFCWLPIPQSDETTAFQYVCSGRYHSHYLDVEESVTSGEYLRLRVRQLLVPGANWHVGSMGDETYTYENSHDSFKGYYMAIENDGLPKVFFGDMGPRAKWLQRYYVKAD
jgi:hypothetical protein